jgi:glycosyltransferase involved in cell wall biosynthesis
MIGVITTSYPLGTADGAGHFVRRRVENLVRNGETVEVIAAGKTNTEETGLARVIRVAAPELFFSGGVPDLLEHRDHRIRRKAWGEAMRFSMKLLDCVQTLKTRWRAVESHWLLPSAIVARTLLPRRPHRAHIHGGDLFLLSHLPFARSMARALCTQWTTLVFVSRDLLRRFENLIGGKIESLGATAKIEAAPIDEGIFFPRESGEKARLRTHKGLRRFTILVAGRLVPIKGIDLLIQALAILPKSVRPFLVIAGDGPEGPNLRCLTERLGVEVMWLGWVPAGELAQWMVAADLFVQPSRTMSNGRSEGMPLAVREALACGLPVVASHSGGMVELEGKAGLSFVALGDVNSLAAAIFDLSLGAASAREAC